MAIWTNRNGSSETSWGSSSGKTTSSWNTRPEFDGEATQIGTIDHAAGTTGTYASAAAASIALIGSRYHLNTDRTFTFGTASEVDMGYSEGAFNINLVEPEGESVDTTLFSINIGDATPFKIMGDQNRRVAVDGLQIESTNRPTYPPAAGVIVYDNGDFWYGAEVGGGPG